jgi:sec-independent protein translocase protein TatC
MSPRQQDLKDPDDFFADTRMSLGDHIEELRGSLWRAIKGFFLAMILGFFIAEPAMHFISSPIEKELMHYYKKRVEKKKEQLEQEKREGSGSILDVDRARPMPMSLPLKALADALGIKDRQFDDEASVTLTVLIHPVQVAVILDEAIRVVGRPPTLSAMSITESFMIWMKVGLYCGLVLASPWIFYQLWTFIGAGLYPHEKRLVHYFLPLSLGLFLAGVALCEFLVLPIGVRYLLSFNEWLNIEPDLRLSEWLSFALLMPLIFGISFQLPLVMYFLDRVGIVTVNTYVSHWRIAIFIIVVLSGLLQVSTDPFSMMAMAIPLCGLYALGILLCKMSAKDKLDMDVPDPEEMVEV